MLWLCMKLCIWAYWLILNESVSVSFQSDGTVNVFFPDTIDYDGFSMVLTPLDHHPHVNKRGIRGIQDSRHSGVLPGTFLKINGILHWLNTDVVYAFQILELYLPAIDGSLICMAALYKVPARPCFRWAAIEYITIKSFVTIFLIVTKYAILSRLLDCRELRAFPGTFFGRIPGTLNFYWCVYGMFGDIWL